MDAPLELDELPYLVGRACCVGDDAGTGQILAANHRGEGNGLVRGIDPGLAARRARGDFIVAGLRFAADDPTAATARALKLAGVGGVIARSFGAEFFRSAVHIGLPALEVEETAAIKTADRLRVDIEGHKVVNLSSGDRYVVRNIHGETLDVLRAGGMSEYLAMRGAHRGAG